MIQLGFGGRILGDPHLATHDGVRAARRPHLSVSLMFFYDILRYLQAQQMHVYRLPTNFAPYLTHPQRPRFHNQIEECAAELRAVGAIVRDANLRLSMHLDSSVVLSTPDPELAERSRHEIEAQAALLRAFNTHDAVVVAHIGGKYDAPDLALQRCLEQIDQLAPEARAMLALEPDGRIWSLVDLLHLHRQTGIPVIFDHLHHQLWNPHQMAHAEALNLALATWPDGRKPKVHFSSPRTELRIGTTTAGRPRLDLPDWHEHSDFAHPFDLIGLLRTPTLRPYDLMLEAKAGDLAVLRARDDIARFAPELVEHVR